MHNFKVYLALVLIRLKGQTSYRKSFLIEILAHIAQMVTHIAGIFFIFYHVKELHDWNVWEVLYLYGIVVTGFSFAQLAAEGFEDLALTIKSGELDQMLTKPISPIIQITSNSFQIERIGGVIQAIVVLCIAIYKTDTMQTSADFLLIVMGIFSIIIVYYSLFLANGALSFWTLENSELFNAFTYGGIEVSRYPLSIYKQWMQSLFVFFIPLGFVCYIPAAELFNKPTNLAISSPHAIFAPVAAITFMSIVLLFWNFSLKHYKSAGS